MSRQVHERVRFRVIQCPPCGHIFCWVNPRDPSYCPECGSQIYLVVKASVLHADDDAVLTTTVNFAHSRQS